MTGNREAIAARVGFAPPEGLRHIHNIEQILLFVDAVLDRNPDGVLVEAGCFQGVGTARLSHLADAVGKRLVVFDSFRGLPDHDERHVATITGRSTKGWFPPGALAGTLEQAQETVERFGIPEVVDWRPGWFADTMPDFDDRIAGVYLDVDLAVSTRTCLDLLWPLLDERGVVVSQDGHLPLVIDEFRRWLTTADPVPSSVEGLGVEQMVRVDR